jgi:DNA-binding NarL/FixJ family response regulator
MEPAGEGNMGQVIQPAQPAQRRSGGAGDEQPARVLVVDDDGEVRDALAESLVAFGLRVVGVAGDGPQGVFMTDTLAPEVVLMDVRMPGMSGLDAARLIKAHQPDVEILVLSAYQDPSFREAAAEAGVAEYIVKGTTTDQIADVIRLAAARFRERKSA